jgi:putative FmdB family regulatory protein
MPLYSYVCTNGHRFDTVTHMSEYRPVVTCLKCGADAKRDFTTARPVIQTETGVGH